MGTSTKINTVILLFIVFILSCFFQATRWKKSNMIDSVMWGDQAQYFLNNDDREFNFLAAYGHPGGTVIEGTILIQETTKIPYDRAVLVFVTLFNSAIITGVCLLLLILTKKETGLLLVIATTITLSFNRLYEYATPPTAIVGPLIVLLFLLTLYIHKNKEQSGSLYLTLWGIIAGLSISTRTDIGAISFIAFLSTILYTITWEKALLVATEAFFVFMLSNPFMWFMPIQHVKDLIFKVTYHYSVIQPSSLPLATIILISSIAIISVLLSMHFLLSKKKGACPSPIPPILIKTLILMTMGLYLVFSMSNIQTERYYLPVIFIWETLFPLLIFTLIEKIESPFANAWVDKNRFQTILKVFVVLVIFFYHSVFFIKSLNI